MNAIAPVPGAPTHHTAATLAAMLGLTKRAVQLRLKAAPPAGEKPTRGGNASAWSMDQLPEEWRAEIARRIRAGELRGHVVQILQPDGSEQTRISFDEIAERIMEDATAAARPETRPASKPTAGALNELAGIADTLRDFGDKANPSAAELSLLWHKCGEHWDAAEAAGRKLKKVRRRMVDFLFDAVPGIARNRESLRKILERKLALWRAGGRIPAACEDQRHTKSGRKGVALPQEDLDKIEGHAVLFCGGRVAQAFRELKRKGELSETVLSGFIANPSRKSYVPRRITQAVSPNVALLDDIHHGPRRAKLNGAHIDRDWSNVFAMDWFQGDDLTAPVYYYEPDGRGWFNLLRGQVLVMIDLRSLCIVSYVLISAAQYNALAIRSLITRTCDEHGLPLRGFYFEQGIWKSSKILTGSKAPFSNGEVEKGLRDLGLEFKHAKLPRAKPVERVLGAIQNWMERCPGYAGRDERHDNYERFERLKKDVASRKVDPRECLFSTDEWNEHLASICDDYNKEPQEGKMLNGMSPEEAFEKLRRADNPPIRLGPQVRYLLAHHRRPIRVTRNGIRLEFGRHTFIYRNEETGRLIGRQVLAFFDPENPDMITVTDLARRNPFAVERVESVPALAATPEEMAAAMASVNAHNGYAKAHYRVLKAKFQPVFRRNIVGTEAAELGTAIESERGRLRAANTTKQARQRKAAETASRHGIAPELLGDERRLSAFEEMQKLRTEGGAE
jgi:hypothetical protein